jgi:hypothetical protein
VAKKLTMKSPRSGAQVAVPQKRQKFGGRAKGTPNKVTSLIKENLLSAIIKVGRPRKAYNKRGEFIGYMPTGEGGMEGYFMHVALTDTKATMGAVAKIMPTQIEVQTERTEPIRTVEEIIEIMREKGVPPHLWPMKLIPPPREDDDALVTINQSSS